MLKYLLVLLLGSPLLWSSYKEAVALLTDAGKVPTVRELSQEQDAIKTGEQTLQDKGKLSPEICAALLAVRDIYPAASANQKPVEKALLKPLQDHGTQLAQIGTFLQCYADIGNGDDKWKDKALAMPREYMHFLDQRASLKVDEKEIREYMAGLSDEGEAKKLRTKLAEYALKAGYSPAFYRKGQAALVELDAEAESKLLVKIVRDTPASLASRDGADRLAQLRNDVDNALAAFKSFERKHEDSLDHKTWVKDQRAVLEKYQALVALAQKDGSSLADEEGLQAHLREYGKLLASPPPHGFQKMVRDRCSRLCDRFVRPVPLSDTILLGDVNPTEYNRSEVTVHWRNDDKTSLSERKEDGTFVEDEFTLRAKEDRIRQFYVNKKGESGPRGTTIRPTPQSEAAHEYNDLRKKLRWTETSLSDIRKRCRSARASGLPLEQELADPVKRVDAVLQAVRENRELFVSSE